LFSNLTFYYSDYDYQIKFGNDSQNRFDWNASIENISIKPEFSFFMNPGNLLKFGGQSILVMLYLVKEDLLLQHNYMTTGKL